MHPSCLTMQVSTRLLVIHGYLKRCVESHPIIPHTGFSYEHTAGRWGKASSSVHPIYGMGGGQGGPGAQRDVRGIEACMCNEPDLEMA
jgi:hypothetical protein